MTERSVLPAVAYAGDSDFSLLAVGTVLLRGRSWIIVLGLLGGLFGLVTGLRRQRLYVSTATFIPQGAETGGSSGLALAASQLGLRVPSSGGNWGPPVYVQLFRTRSILEPVIADSIAVTEEGGRKRSVPDLLNISTPTPELTLDRTVTAMRLVIDATEIKDLNAVKISVTTPWPSVSLELAQRLVSGINRFNLETRKSQATAERKFVETRAAEAEKSLRDAEDRLQAFLQANRTYSGSPELNFQHSRLERDMELRQQSYNALLVSREEARIREVRDIPVITVLDAPRLPLVGESRHTGQRIVLGGLAGCVLGALIVLIANGVRVARRAPTPEAQEFFESLDSATPRLLRRGGR